MRFARPKGKKITELCMVVDSLIKKDSLTKDEEDLMVLYLYHIIYALAKKRDYFYFEEDCDNFSFYLAEKLFYRFTTKDDTKIQVNSCLNYIKKVLYPRIVNWQSQVKFKEVIEDSSNNTGQFMGRYMDTRLYKEELRDAIKWSNRDAIIRFVYSEIAYLPTLIDKVCRNTQYRANPEIQHRLYMSCILSMLNSITLPKYVIEKSKDVVNEDNFLLKRTFKNFENSIILWHLGEEMRPFVTLLLNRIRKLFIEKLYLYDSMFDISTQTLDLMLSGEKVHNYD